MLLKNASVLLGKDLQYVNKINIKIRNGIITKIKSNLHPSPKEPVIDCEGLLIMPGFINSHTHIGDSIAKDIVLAESADNKINPVYGLKSKILQSTDPKILTKFMEFTCKSMLRKGITTFIDFREGGIEGITLLKQALEKVPIRSVILGRIDYYQNIQQIRKNERLPSKKIQELNNLLTKCDGIGVSGANENSNSVLKSYSKTSKLRAIHSAETQQSIGMSKKITKKSEVLRALQLKPHFLVHMTYATKSELFVTAKKTRGIVVCPRANAALAEGIPDVDLMLKTNCNVTIGTDNVMINSPDIFKELDYLWKTTMGLHKKIIEPLQILKMATVNAGKLLHKKIGVIETGALADLVFILKHSVDLEPIHNPYASIVQRTSESSIKAVMIGGKIVYGKI